MGVRVPSFAPSSIGRYPDGRPTRQYSGGISQDYPDAAGSRNEVEPARAAAEGGGAGRAARGRDRRADQEARANGEDAGLPARQGADQDGRAPLRVPGAPGSALGERAALFRRGGEEPELPRGRPAAFRAGAGRNRCERLRVPRRLRGLSRHHDGRPCRAQGDAPVDAGERQGRRGDDRDASQAARHLRARRAGCAERQTW